jgi:hypothetical protein
VGWPAPCCTSCRCSCHSSAFALTFPRFSGPHVGSVPHSTHGSTSQCLPAHCTFALSPRLLLAPCSHARHPRSRSVSVAAQDQRFRNSHQAGLMGIMGNLPRLDPLRHFANQKHRNVWLGGGFLLMPAMNSLFFVVDQFWVNTTVDEPRHCPVLCRQTQVYACQRSASASSSSSLPHGAALFSSLCRAQARQPSPSSLVRSGAMGHCRYGDDASLAWATSDALRG